MLVTDSGSAAQTLPSFRIIMMLSQMSTGRRLVPGPAPIPTIVGILRRVAEYSAKIRNPLEHNGERRRARIAYWQHRAR